MTAGATEAITAAVLALCEPDDEVVMFEPYYDSYAPAIAMAGARRRVVPLRPPFWDFDLDGWRRRSPPGPASSCSTRPHNPTGKVFSADELAGIARLCIEADLLAVTDEVYEHLVFEGRHVPLASLPGMARAHAHGFERRQDVLVHRMEDRLDLRPRPAGGGRAHGQAVLDLRERRTVPTGGRRRAWSYPTSSSPARRGTWPPGATACATACATPGSRCSARPPPTSP